MVATAYQTVLEMAESLSPADRARLLERLGHAPVTSDADRAPKKHSIMELRGLGKEIWQGVDAKEYVRKMRDEWDG